ncbi:MAG: PAS domain S-box protein [Armatimonadetes bacterium]|nr:PAS domain S-box protein [Armatimonadota bacterium]
MDCDQVPAAQDGGGTLSRMLRDMPAFAYRCANDPDWTMEYVSDGCLELTGYAPDALVASKATCYGDLIAPQDRDRVWSAVQSAVGRNASFDLVYRIRRADGREAWVHERGRPIIGARGEVEALEGFIALTDDHAEALRASMRRWGAVMDGLPAEDRQTLASTMLAATDAQFRAAMEQAAIGICYLSLDGRYLWLNSKYCENAGWPAEDLMRLGPSAIVHPDDVETGRADSDAAMQGGPKQYQAVRRCITKEGKTRYNQISVSLIYDDHGEPMYFMSAIHDITAKVEAEERSRREDAALRQSQKLEALGTLAAGVAHEINNPLMGIINYAQIIQDAGVDDEMVNLSARGIASEGARIATIAGRLLEFAGMQADELAPTTVAYLINNTLDLARHALSRAGVRVDVQVDDPMPTVVCRPQQIRQVLLNLIMNAKDAMAATETERRLAVRARETTEDGRAWLHVEVEDSGHGVAAEHLERIFDPFYTTKQRTKGTGLGLSVSHGIVRDHGGSLTVQSEPGRGAVFTLRLPVDGPPQHQPHPPGA